VKQDQQWATGGIMSLLSDEQNHISRWQAQRAQHAHDIEPALIYGYNAGARITLRAEDVPYLRPGQTVRADTGDVFKIWAAGQSPPPPPRQPVKFNEAARDEFGRVLVFDEGTWISRMIRRFSRRHR